MFQEINRLNRNREFLAFREKSLALILSVYTFGGIAIIMIWHLFDFILFPDLASNLTILRAVTILILLLNWVISRKHSVALKQRTHILIGLYAGGIFCSILNQMTGGSISPNWVGMLFILVTFMIMPFPYLQVVIHSIILLVINGFITTYRNTIDLSRLGEIYFLYTGFLIIAILTAIVHNYKDVQVFMNMKALDDNLKKESETFKVENELLKYKRVLEKAPGMITIFDKHGQFNEYITFRAMEEALLLSEEKYRHLINSLQEGLFVITEGKFVFLNEAILNIVGYSTNELIGQEFLMTIAPECRDRVMSNHLKRIAGEEVDSTYETILLHKDQVRKIPAIISVKLTNYEGKPAVIGTARDITQRIAFEAELKKAKAELEIANKKLEQLVSEQSLELDKATGQLLDLKNKNLQTQFEFLKSQVNPHFLFNSLNVLVSLIKIKPALAEKFTEQLAKAYRYIIENKDKDLVSVQTELEFLSAYIFLLNIRFKDKLIIDIDVTDNVRDMYLVPLALQLLMENCIKHNTFSKAMPLNIKIYSDKSSYITVTNNLQIRQSHFASTGVGLKNIESRYALISDNKPQFIQTETEFTARIPLIETI